MYRGCSRYNQDFRGKKRYSPNNIICKVVKDMEGIIIIITREEVAIEIKIITEV